MFKVGDMAVYPTQGVGVIEDIEIREYSGHSQNFYILRIVGSDMKIMVPVGNGESLWMKMCRTNLQWQDRVVEPPSAGIQ